jgi:hypothetical protein
MHLPAALSLEHISIKHEGAKERRNEETKERMHGANMLASTFHRFNVALLTCSHVHMFTCSHMGCCLQAECVFDPTKEAFVLFFPDLMRIE